MAESIINKDLQKNPYDQYQDKFQEAFEISKNYPSNSLGPFVEQGMSSDMRHQLGASGGKDTIIDYLSNFGINPQGKFADTIGNFGIGVATAATEIPDAFKMAGEAIKRGDIDALTSARFLNQPIEDVKSNFAAMDIPYGLTTKEKENFVLANYPNYAPNINSGYTYGSVNANELGGVPNTNYYGSPAFTGPMPQPKPADIAKTNNPYDYNLVDAQTIDEITAPQVSPFLGSADYQGDPNAIQRQPQGFFSKVVEGGKNFLGAAKNFMPNFGIMGLLSNLDRFDTLPIEDQEFILEQSGGNRPSKDPFGINRRSAFGNYAQYVRDKGIFAKGPRGEYYRSISGLDKALMDTLDREQKAKAAYEKQIRDAANEAARNKARAESIKAGYGGADESRGATGPTAAGAGMGVGGGYASDYFGADGGSVPTGLATMFVEKR